jgi:hypothetical protein
VAVIVVLVAKKRVESRLFIPDHEEVASDGDCAGVRKQREGQKEPGLAADDDECGDVNRIANPAVRPDATNRRGASQGPGVPRPTVAKSQRHHA